MRTLLCASIAVLLMAIPAGAAYDSFDEAYQAGKEMAHEQEFQDARAAFKEAVDLAELGREKSRAQLEAGLASFAARDLEQAMEDFREVEGIADANPNDIATARIYTGHIHMIEDEPERAKASYQRVFDLADAGLKKQIEAMNALYRYCLAVEVPPHAQDLFDRVRMSAQLVDSQEAEASFFRGLSEMREGNYAESRKHFREVVESRRAWPSRQAWAQIHIAETYAREDSPGQAAEALYELTQWPGVSADLRTHARVMLGDIYREMGQTEEAEEQYRHVVEAERAHEEQVEYAQNRLQEIG